MARRRVTSAPQDMSKIEWARHQVQQSMGTSFSSDTIYTADDQVRLKRIIADGLFAIGTATAASHGIVVVYILPKDVADPAFVGSDGDIVAEGLVILVIPFAAGASSDGQLDRFSYDVKKNLSLNPGDKIKVGYVVTADNLISQVKFVSTLKLAH